MEQLLILKRTIDGYHNGNVLPSQDYFDAQNEMKKYIESNVFEYKGFIPMSLFVKSAIDTMFEYYGHFQRKGSDELYFSHALRTAGLVNFYNKNEQRKDIRLASAILREAPEIKNPNKKKCLGLDKIADLFGLDVASNVGILSVNGHGWLSAYNTMFNLSKMNKNGDLLIVLSSGVSDTLNYDISCYKKNGKKYFKHIQSTPEKRLAMFGEIAILAKSHARTKKIGENIITLLGEFSELSGIIPN
jgi:hypothetical protein